jgi:hypothetical protein
LPPWLHHPLEPEVEHVVQIEVAEPDAVAYLLAADKVSRPFPIRLREVNQPVIRSRNAFSRPFLACLAGI